MDDKIFANSNLREKITRLASRPRDPSTARRGIKSEFDGDSGAARVKTGDEEIRAFAEDRRGLDGDEDSNCV